MYFRELDGLRFIAVLLVFVHHAGPLFDEPATGVIGVIRQGGWIGVDLFFALSGYLITRILVREWAKFGAVHLKAFWIRRILRIWPLYFFALFLGFAVLPLTSLLPPAFGSRIHLGLLARHGPAMGLFLGNVSVSLFGYPDQPFLAPLWSISVEEQFYFLWPVVLAFLPMRRAVVVAAAGLIVAPVVRYLLVELLHPDYLVIYVNTLARADVILIGCLGGLIAELAPQVLLKLKGVATVAILILSVGVLGGVMARFEVGDVRAPLSTALWYSVLAGAAGFTVAGLVNSPELVRSIVGSPPMAWLGRVSYGLYVYHRLAIAVVQTGLGWHGGIAIVTAFALTVLTAATSYYFLERPFLQLKRRWTRVATRPI